VNLSTAETGAALGTPTDLIEAVEAGQPADAATAERIEALIDQWTS
jgi:hypothetical protein